ncbi:hypothetical protein EGM51_17560 [Verrucomicrobia bacterium S94]|nr:hypothetical protein EGM51_17560 [Verrucomicrobia bacterium S94]
MLNDMGEELDVYREIFELKSGEDLRAWVSLILLCHTLDGVESDQVEAKSGSLLDIGGALRFLALENVLVNNDGYWARALYLIPAGRKGGQHWIH